MAKGLDSVAKDEAEIAEEGGVGKVALHATTREFVGKGIAESGENFNIALGVFKGDGIDLLGHGRGADFSSDNLLGKIAAADVTPHILVKVANDLHGDFDFVQEAGDIIMGFNLGGKGNLVEFGVKAGDEASGDRTPTVERESSDTGGVVTTGAVEFSVNLYIHNVFGLALKSVEKYAHLFSESGWSGGLAVGVREHGGCGFSNGEFAEFCDNVVEALFKEFSSVNKHQGIGEVCDVLASATDMDETLEGVKAGIVKFLGDKEFAGFDIVVGDTFKFLYYFSVSDGKVARNIV